MIFRGIRLIFQSGRLGAEHAQTALTTRIGIMHMAQAILDIARLRALLSYDPETGIFRWLVNRPPNKTAGKEAGSPDDDGYLRIGIDRRRYRAHRLAWFYVHGVWPQMELDHKDTDRTNNRIANLREATRTVNQQNIRKSPAKASTLPMGVTMGTSAKNPYAAQISMGNRKVRIGSYASEQEAHEAYLAAKRQMHAGCTL